MIVETVGVGQSETAVAGMTDVFVLLQLPNAGDELQAIKKGIVELADLVVVNKADIDPQQAAQRRARRCARAGDAAPASPHWQPPVLTLSALTGDGIDEFWQEIEAYRETMQRSGEFDAEAPPPGAGLDVGADRHAACATRFRKHPASGEPAGTRGAVEAGAMTPAAAAQRLLAHLRGG